MEDKTKSLDAQFKIPEFNNIYEVDSDTETIRYIGKATALYFKELNILGKSSIIKIKENKKKIILPENKVHELLLNIGDIFKKDETEIIIEWDIRTKYNNYFLYNGSIVKYYSQTLKGEAANRGILLSDDLLEKVFSPIEQQIMKLYLDVKNYG